MRLAGIAPCGRELGDTIRGFFPQRRRLACDAYLAEPFDLGDSSIERVNKLTERNHDEIATGHRLIVIHGLQPIEVGATQVALVIIDPGIRTAPKRNRFLRRLQRATNVTVW